MVIERISRKDLELTRSLITAAISATNPDDFFFEKLAGRMPGPDRNVPEKLYYEFASTERGCKLYRNSH